MSRKLVALTVLFLLIFPLFAEDVPLTPGVWFDSGSIQERTIKKGDFFRVMCEHELREEQGFDMPVLYSTYNHEGGMKVRVIEVGNREEYKGETGIWLHVTLIAPIYVTTGAYINRGAQYWFFLPDSQQIFDYND